VRYRRLGLGLVSAPAGLAMLVNGTALFSLTSR
jgi:hypothetical protein